jgi:hypothetical protein
MFEKAASEYQDIFFVFVTQTYSEIFLEAPHKTRSIFRALVINIVTKAYFSSKW